MDRRALPGLVAGLAGLLFGVTAAVLSSPTLAVVAAGCALAAGAASLAMVRMVREIEREADEVRERAETLPEPMEPDVNPVALIDPDTGFPDQHFFHLALESRVAAARRHLWPVAIVLLELGFGPEASHPEGRTQALSSFADLMRQTLREADIACRIGPASIGLILEDTSEEGGVWTAERLQIALAKDVTRVRRLAAGVASYPTHGLGTEEILVRAKAALSRACAAEAGHGLGQVEVAHSD